ncbi:hypothetical protein JHD48_09650 [Sulfurimonas sp. SAG-AH-194-I05]|nr:hypothetical protein [Sulfurimonas sp. SAG-AH-194-I05]MDF1875999.1 hypothetical protein [Sulfurimonas sp. SAG-AH-194-I05]
MEDNEYIKTYATGIFMLELLREWNDIERLGSIALLYNTLTKKHENFHIQIAEVKNAKKKKHSKKCDFYILANILSMASWKDISSSTKDYTISANTVIHCLYMHNKDNFEKLYGLKKDLFVNIDKTQQKVTLSSCKIARLLLESIEEKINNTKEAI